MMQSHPHSRHPAVSIATLQPQPQQQQAVMAHTASTWAPGALEAAAQPSQAVVHAAWVPIKQERESLLHGAVHSDSGLGVGAAGGRGPSAAAQPLRQHVPWDRLPPETSKQLIELRQRMETRLGEVFPNNAHGQLEYLLNKRQQCECGFFLPRSLRQSSSFSTCKKKTLAI